MSGISPFSALAVILYLAAAAVAAQAGLAARKGMRVQDSRFWIAAAALFLCLTASRVLGIEAGLTEDLRAELKQLMLYKDRYEVQGIIASVVIVVAAVFIALWLWRRTRTPWRKMELPARYRIAGEVACGAMACLVLLRLVSLHMIDSLLYRGPHLNWLVDVGATLAIIGLSRGYVRALRAPLQRTRQDKAPHRRR